MVGVNRQGDRILQSTRSGFEYLEHARVHVDGERVVFAKASDAIVRSWAVPCVNTSAVLLGPGTSVTHAAMRKLAEERVLVAFVGTGGTPIFMGSTSEYAPTEHLVRWISFWTDGSARLRAAKHLSHERCNAVDRLWLRLGSDADSTSATLAFRRGIDAARSVDELRGFEGEFARTAYKLMAKATGLKWSGRQPGEGADLANSMLDQGNYLAYGVAGVVLWALAISPGLAVNHGVTRAGGLVFDLADALKDAVVLPIAFACASEGASHGAFREAVIDAFDRYEVLTVLFGVMKDTIDHGAGL